MALFTLQELLMPFEYLEMGSLYSRYSFIIDSIIVFFIFFGVAQVTLGKRFEGRGGRAITIGIGLALSTGFLLMERTLNFSLQSFGPLAAAIILLLVGFVFYSVLVALGFKHINAVCLAYIIDYLSLRLVSPTIFDWIAAQAPFINGILGLGFIIALIKLLFSLFSRTSIRSLSSSVSNLPSRLSVRANTEDYDKEITEDKEEAGIISDRIMGITKKEIKDSDEMRKIITETIKVIEKHGTTPQALREVSGCLNKIKEKEHYALVYLGYIHKILDTIGRYDAEAYANMKVQYETASDSAQKRYKKKEIEAQERKHEIEMAVDRIENLIMQYTKQFNQCLNAAVQALGRGSINDALSALKSLLQIEDKIKSYFEQMQSLESDLKTLTKKELKFHKKEKKKFP